MVTHITSGGSFSRSVSHTDKWWKFLNHDNHRNAFRGYSMFSMYCTNQKQMYINLVIYFPMILSTFCRSVVFHERRLRWLDSKWSDAFFLRVCFFLLLLLLPLLPHTNNKSTITTTMRPREWCLQEHQCVYWLHAWMENIALNPHKRGASKTDARPAIITQSCAKQLF